MITSKLRNDLVLWLSKTQAASRELTPKSARKFCEQLGITEELFREAHMLRAKNDFKLYNSKGRHGDYVARKLARQDGKVSLVAHCSAELKQHFIEYCKTRNVDHITFARSVIHHYLRGTWEPEHVMKWWSIRSFSGDQSAVKEENVHVTVTGAAKEAFRKRALSSGTSPTKLMRQILSSALNGEFAQPGTIRYIARGQMFSREELYVVPD